MKDEDVQYVHFLFESEINYLTVQLSKAIVLGDTERLIHSEARGSKIVPLTTIAKRILALRHGWLRLLGLCPKAFE